jgi:histidinol-phosphate/aromatic aminotransferase/cobyric acid decarboxylase-like protein
MTKDLKKHNIDFIPSETNYLLIEANRSRGDVAEDLERENMILYESIDEVDDYWTLPISMKSDVNTKVINILNYSD